jgi:signal transduction histidine kinase
MAAEASEREEKYRRLSGRLLTLQDEERRRLALDLHDSTSQRLAALAINLDVIGQTAKALDARSRRALAESRSLADQCAREVRTFAYLLHPPLLDEVGLLSALRWYAEGFANRSGIHIAMDLGEIGRLPGPVETALYRVVQESLTNIVKHAHARRVSILVTQKEGAVVAVVEDDGSGFDPAETREDGFGITGMRERLALLDGRLEIESSERGGTTLVAEVPLR